MEQGTVSNVPTRKNELRDSIAELSTAGFEGYQSTVGSMPAIARQAEEAGTYSAKIEVEKRQVERNLRKSVIKIRKNRDIVNSASSDARPRAW
jgi:hypothetical protein